MSFMGETVSIIAMRPFTLFILLTIATLILPCVVIPIWYDMTKKIEKNVNLEASYARYELITKVEDVAKLIPPINSSAINLASVLDSQITDDRLLFSQIQTKVAPALFQAHLTIPHIIQASYIGLDGLLFAYFKDDDQIFAMYSNSTFANKLGHYTWYTQHVNSSSGKLHGGANITKPLIVVNESWFKQAMNSPNGYASLGFRWSISKGNGASNLFLDNARLGGVGAISLGFPIEGFTTSFSSTKFLGASLYLATVGDGKVLLGGLKEANITINGDKALVQGSNKDYVDEILCKPSSNDVTNAGGTTVDIGGATYIFFCSSIDIGMVPMVYVLAFPSNGLVSHVHKHTEVAFIILILMLVAMVITMFAFVALIVRAARREVHLCTAYMREMEKTAQAERKSMKQSLAFASANHDVRGYLACIKGLTDLSSSDVNPSSELASNLRKINTCAEDLLGLVSSILDISKIEAGKMQLEEKEFSIAQLLEDIADLHHPVAMKKGVEVILDPCDGSVFRYSLVRGDCGKLKQILGNLISNAVKFTSKGNVCIKCHAKKPSLENLIISSNRNNLLNRMSHVFYKNKRAYNDFEEMKTVMQDPNCMEFEFKVEDTGPGIPRDKRRLIFENFVQVKETSAGQVGTGLGLGIVQSLVRLMGGDIEIADKTNGEQGACFKFNIFLIVKEELLDNSRQEATEHRDIHLSSGIRTCARSPRGEKSLVILLIKNGERRAVVHRYMESLGINLKVLSQWKHLSATLKKIKSKLIEPRYCSSSGRSDLSPTCATYLSSSSDRGCRGKTKLLPLNIMDGSDNVLPVYKRSSVRGSIKCILLVIDCNAGDDFQKLQRSVSEFKKHLYMTCIKVVWLDRPDTRRTHFHGLLNESLPWTDLIITEPLHGSRLSRIVRLLPEFGGDSVRSPTCGTSKRSNTSIEVPQSNTQSETEELAESSGGEIKPYRKRQPLKFNISSDNYAQEQEVSQVLRSSSSDDMSKMRTKPTTIGDIQEVPKSTDIKKTPLEGKKILIVEDHLLQRKLAETCVKRLGAQTETCENGKEALQVVCTALSNLLNGELTKFPYDCIIMDCQSQMPVMDGFEATRRIREEEKKYRIHIPIIALSSHEVDGEEGMRIAEAGMDFHLTKPLQSKELLFFFEGRVKSF